MKIGHILEIFCVERYVCYDILFVLDFPGEQDDDHEELLEAANFACNFSSMFLEYCRVLQKSKYVSGLRSCLWFQILHALVHSGRKCNQYFLLSALRIFPTLKNR